ncbi:MAG: hypothetical protein WBE34_06305 [Candidatus Nitrosopolaris sp.]
MLGWCFIPPPIASLGSYSVHGGETFFVLGQKENYFIRLYKVVFGATGNIVFLVPNDIIPE